MSLISTSQVETLLETVLFESPTQASADAAAWATQVPASATTAAAAVDSLASAMAASPEAGIATEVMALYVGLLDRVPQAAEIQYYVNLLEASETPAQVALGMGGISVGTWNTIVGDFVNSAEFKASQPNNDLVSVLYHNVLGRTPSSAELAYYDNLLAQGASDGQLVHDFIDSQEFRSGERFQLAGSTIEFLGDQLATGVSGASSLTLPGLYNEFWSEWLNSDSGTATTAVTLATGSSGSGSSGIGTGGVTVIGSAGSGISFSSAPSGNMSITLSNGVSVGTIDLSNLFVSANSTTTRITTMTGAVDGPVGHGTTFHFDNLSDNFAGAAVDVSLAASQAQALDLAAAAAGTLAAASAKLEWFQSGGNTYLVEVTNAGIASTHTALAGTDYVVKLTGLIDVSAHGTFDGGHNFTV